MSLAVIPIGIPTIMGTLSLGDTQSDSMPKRQRDQRGCLLSSLHALCFSFRCLRRIAASYPTVLYGYPMFYGLHVMTSVVTVLAVDCH